MFLCGCGFAPLWRALMILFFFCLYYRLFFFVLRCCVYGLARRHAPRCLAARLFHARARANHRPTRWPKKQKRKTNATSDKRKKKKKKKKKKQSARAVL